jgi:hypothetical protein
MRINAKFLIYPVSILIFAMLVGVAQADITGTITSNGYGCADYEWSVNGSPGCGDYGPVTLDDDCYSGTINVINPNLQLLGVNGDATQCASNGGSIGWQVTLGPIGGGGGGGGGNPPPTGSFQIRVNNGAWEQGNVFIPFGGFIDLSWTSQNANDCSFLPNFGWSGPNFNTDDFGPFDQPGNYSAELYCSGPGGNNVLVDSAIVTVGPGPVTAASLSISWGGGSVTANKGEVKQISVPYGTTVSVDWASANVNNCVLTENGNPVDNRLNANNVPYLVNGPVTGTLSCNGPNGPAAATVEIGSLGTIYINMTQNQPWNFTAAPAGYSGPMNGVGPTTINNAPFGFYDLSAADVPGYTVTITPCNPQNLNQTAAACD